jgi:hypothetical protein
MYSHPGEIPLAGVIEIESLKGVGQELEERAVELLIVKSFDVDLGRREEEKPKGLMPETTNRSGIIHTSIKPAAISRTGATSAFLMCQRSLRNGLAA